MNDKSSSHSSFEVFSHPIKRYAIEKTVVRYECDNPFIPNPVSNPHQNCLYVRIVEFIFKRCFGGFGIRLRNPFIYCLMYLRFLLLSFSLI